MKWNINSWLKNKKVQNFNDSEAFNEYSNGMDDTYKNIDKLKSQ